MRCGRAARAGVTWLGQPCRSYGVPEPQRASVAGWWRYGSLAALGLAHGTPRPRTLPGAHPHPNERTPTRTRVHHGCNRAQPQAHPREDGEIGFGISRHHSRLFRGFSLYLNEIQRSVVVARHPVRVPGLCKASSRRQNGTPTSHRLSIQFLLLTVVVREEEERRERVVSKYRRQRMSGRPMDSDDESLEKIGRGTRLQSHAANRLGPKRKRARANVDNRVVVVIRLPVRLSLQKERDLHDETMTMSKFLREVVIAEWLAERGYTKKGMEREAMRYVLAEEQARLDAEEADETPRYRLEA